MGAEILHHQPPISEIKDTMCTSEKREGGGRLRYNEWKTCSDLNESTTSHLAYARACRQNMFLIASIRLHTTSN